MDTQRWKIIKTNEILKDHFASRWQGYLLSLFALFFLSIVKAEVSFYFFLYFCGFLYAQVFFSENWNWFRRLLVAPLLSAGAIVLVCALFDVTNIPIGIWCIYLVWFGSLFIAFKFPFSVNSHELRDYQEYWFEILLTAIFVIGLAARVLPVINEPAPILHDPEAHAYMAKQIIKTGKVERFYSPGLHFNIAMATLTTNVSLARNTLMITQFFNALITVTSGIFIFEFSKRKWWAIMAGTLFAVGSQPAGFYTAAGKNALVFNTAFLFLVWAVFLVDIRKTHKIILSNLILLVAILSHYPSAFICCLGLMIMFLLTNSKRLFLSYMIFALIAGVIWGGLKMSYQVEKLETLEFNRVKNNTLADVLTYQNVKTQIKNAAVLLGQTFPLTDREYDRTLWPLGFLTMLFLGAGERKYWFFPIYWVISFVLITVGRFFRPINPLWIVTSTEIITDSLTNKIIIALPMAMVLFEAWGERNKKFWTISSILVLIVVVSGAFSLARRYSEYQARYHMIEQSDVDAFEWMANNLNPGDRILVDAMIKDHRIVFAGDSGLWIPVYTDFVTSSPFEKFAHKDTHYDTNLYLKLAKDPNNCRFRSMVLEGGFKYYFRGSRPVFATPMNVTEDAFKLIYDNGSVKIYQILPCNTDQNE
jgi:hypothetical protein